MSEDLENVVRRAVAGDRNALERVVETVQKRVYNLALRMLWHPEDAEDATQEILLKVAANLGSFRGESALSTWALRIAANHLRHIRRSRMELQELSFAGFADDLQQGLAEPASPPADRPDQALLEQEVKIGCTHAMLLCLDREHRLAYILGDVFELPGGEAAKILDVPAATYRKRVSRARAKIREFMRAHCGLVADAAACRCSRRVAPALAAGRIHPERQLFAQRENHVRTPTTEAAEMDELHRIASIYRNHPEFDTPERLGAAVRQLLEAHQLRVLR